MSGCCSPSSTKEQPAPDPGGGAGGSLGAAVGAPFWPVLDLRRSIPPATSAGPGRTCQLAGFAASGGSRQRYCAVILLHCASAACLIDAIGMFAAVLRQACFALPSAELTFALLVVI